jgi:sugar transferase (PEP-CTERM/EpsH1 system associated)
VDALQLRNRERRSRLACQDLYVTFRKDISGDPEENLKAIPRKQRAMVRKGIQAGLRGRVVDDLDAFFPIYAESVRNLGTPVFPRRYFQLLHEVFAADCELSVIDHGGEDIAAVMSFYFRDEVLPYYGGSRPPARDLKGNDFMYWDLMCRAAERGVRVFDYGRSKRDTGSFSFKKNWGFTSPLLRVPSGQGRVVPEVNPNNPVPLLHRGLEASAAAGGQCHRPPAGPPPWMNGYRGDEGTRRAREARDEGHGSMASSLALGPRPSEEYRPDLLFLCHRIPYPPDKGDKIRSYHWLCALAQTFRVHLAAFVDDPADWIQREKVAALCATCLLLPLRSPLAKVKGLVGLLSGEALSLPYYRNPGLRRWVDRLRRTTDIRHVVVYSSAMAQYAAIPAFERARRVIDFVDVDSDKWRQYAARMRGPMRWVYRREAARIEAFELAIARAFDASLFVSPAEAAWFRGLLGAGGERVTHVNNGVDSVYFDPGLELESPFPVGAQPVVFTGAMDYWANADAVVWFCCEVWPRVRARQPQAAFYIVGARPSPAVQALAGDGVVVTGRVPDVRPYLRHAQAVVAPMRIARGIQNKVLEDVHGASGGGHCQGSEGIPAADGREVLVANDAAEFARHPPWRRARRGLAPPPVPCAARVCLDDNCHAWCGSWRPRVSHEIDERRRQQTNRTRPAIAPPGPPAPPRCRALGHGAGARACARGVVGAFFEPLVDRVHLVSLRHLRARLFDRPDHAVAGVGKARRTAPAGTAAGLRAPDRDAARRLRVARRPSGRRARGAAVRVRRAPDPGDLVRHWDTGRPRPGLSDRLPVLRRAGGEGLIHPMINFTADFTVGMLRLTACRRTDLLSIPSGDWSVIDECSGCAISSLRLPRSALRLSDLRSVVALVVRRHSSSVIANGLRAYMIVMIAHSSDMRLARASIIYCTDGSFSVSSS